MLCQDDALKAARNIVQRPAHTESAEGAARLAAEGGRRQARQRAEARAERAEALIADLEADFRHAVVGGLGEQAVEIERRKAGLPGDFGQKNGPRVVPGEIIAGGRGGRTCRHRKAARRAWRRSAVGAGIAWQLTLFLHEKARSAGRVLKFTERRFTSEENFA